jgi:hypothetical protein
VGEGLSGAGVPFSLGEKVAWVLTGYIGDRIDRRHG